MYSSACSQNIRNFNSPETVVQYFVNNVKTGNFENVFLTSPYSNDTLVRKINPRGMINYMGSNLFNIENIPVEYYSVMKYSLLGRYSTAVKRFIFHLLLQDQYPEFVTNLTPMNISDSILDNYFLMLNIGNLRSLEFVRMDVYRPDIQFSERGKNNTIRQYISTYGCDEKVDYVVLYRHNNKYYAGGLTMVRYGANWYIDSLNSTYANIVTGSLIQVSGISEYLHEYEIK
jgi:hypothetical protein